MGRRRRDAAGGGPGRARGPAYHAPFDTGPPSLGTAAVDPGGLERTGRLAASAALDAVRRLLALLDRDPPATLQAGGVGIRELRRAAEQLPATEAAVRLWLETAAGAGLLAPAGEGVLATTDADGWLASDPADALARLLLAWWRLPIVPGHRVDDAGKPVPALVRAFGGGEHRRLRADALAAIADVDPGRGIVETDSLAAVLAFQAPVVYGGPDLPARLRSTVAEAWPPTARSPRFGPTCSPPSTRPTPRPGWRMQRPACCPRPRAPPPSCPT